MHLHMDLASFANHTESFPAASGQLVLDLVLLNDPWGAFMFGWPLFACPSLILSSSIPVLAIFI